MASAVTPTVTAFHGFAINGVPHLEVSFSDGVSTVFPGQQVTLRQMRQLARAVGTPQTPDELAALLRSETNPPESAAAP